MKRDFTQETLNRLNTLVQQSDENWFRWTDALGDFFLDIGVTEVIGFLGGIEAHQRAIFDQNNTSLEDLQRIFNTAWALDDTYGAIFANHVEKLSAFHERLKAVGAPMIALSSYTSITSEFTDLTIRKEYQAAFDRYASYLEQHPEAFDTIRQIALYENRHPEYVEQTNTFFSALPLGDELEIKRLTYQQGEPARTLCLRYLDQFTIASTTIGGVFKPAQNTLEFDLARDRTEPRGSYYVFFHELGHAIDWYYGLEQGGSGYYSGTYTNNGQTLMEINYDDVRFGLTATAHTLLGSSASSSLSATQKSTIVTNVVDNLMLQNRNFLNLTTDEQMLQVRLVQNYNNHLLQGTANEAASDIYGGVTNNWIVGSYSHPSSKNYWFNPDLTVNRGTNMECFAEYFGRVMIEDPQSTDGLNSINTYLPGSKTFMDQMLVGMS